MVSLSSHSSIYNALINPELELPPSVERPSSVLSQSTEGSPRPSGMSSMVVVPSPQVMVFDTDEEDGGEEFPRFVMPTMSLSPAFRIAVVTAMDDPESARFLGHISRELAVLDNLSLQHISLSAADARFAQHSDLLFVVNDGSEEFVSFMQQVFSDRDDGPKLTIINMTAVNYFINLFDLISEVKPYQMWKAPALTPQLVAKTASFIESEYSGQPRLLQAADPSVYCSLVTTHRSDYRRIERQFRSDLTSSMSGADPLHIGSKFFIARPLYYMLKRAFVSSGGNGDRFWVVASFTLGVGLGMSIASGVATMVGYYIWELLGSVEPPAPPAPPVAVPVSSPSELKVLTDVVSTWVRGGMEKFMHLLMSF
ncbi:hypothetical protein DICA3_B11298 [Diutina catenulata]